MRFCIKTAQKKMRFCIKMALKKMRVYIKWCYKANMRQIMFERKI